jgi:hypothetical protein
MNVDMDNDNCISATRRTGVKNTYVMIKTEVESDFYLCEKPNVKSRRRFGDPSREPGQCLGWGSWLKLKFHA